MGKGQVQVRCQDNNFQVGGLAQAFEMLGKARAS